LLLQKNRQPWKRYDVSTATGLCLSYAPMQSELIIRRIATRQFDVSDSADRSFELNDISESQLLGFLRRQRLVDATPEEVLAQFAEKRSIVHVAIER